MSAFASHDSATKQSAGDAITAEEIAATETRVSRADGTRLTSGSERGDDGPTTFDPAQEMKHLDGDGAPTDLGKPMPSTGGFAMPTSCLMRSAVASPISRLWLRRT